MRLMYMQSIGKNQSRAGALMSGDLKCDNTVYRYEEDAYRIVANLKALS